MHKRTQCIRIVVYVAACLVLAPFVNSCALSDAPASAEPTAAPAESPVPTVPAVVPSEAPAEAAVVATSSPAMESEPLATPTLAVAAPKSVDQLQRITPEELKLLIESGADLIVVDNQPSEAYAVEHIPGAVNFPWETEIPSPAKLLPKGKLVVLYCGCAHEEDSTDVAGQLLKRGYTKVMLLDGGWLRWVELGYPKEAVE